MVLLPRAYTRVNYAIIKVIKGQSRKGKNRKSEAWQLTLLTAIVLTEHVSEQWSVLKQWSVLRRWGGVPSGFTPPVDPPRWFRIPLSTKPDS